LAPGAAIADAVEAVAATPRARMRAELGWLGDAPNPYVRRLASGDREAVGALVRGLHTAYDALVAPDAEVLARWTAAERAARAADVLDGGVHRLLGNLCPDVVWEPPVLRLVCQVEQGTVDLYLDGQGLVLQPCFGRGAPGVVIDAAGPPVLAYPMADPGELMPDASLAAALGATRARVLATMSAGATTSQIATRLGISAASASEHATVLRAARLVTSRRLGPAVLHTLTPLGRALLAAPGEGPGESPGDGRRRRPDPVGR
jgi:DNA-binding transcriptional ArsR family regulator